MLYTEFNIEEAKEVWQEEAHMKGLEKGREEVFDLLVQKLPKEEIEEMKQRLMQTKTSK